MGFGDSEPGPVVGLTAVRVRLDIGYDGTGFSGWARQPGQRTVQGTLEDALARVLNLAEPAALTVAGRTDAGVHARGQVAHADIPADRWADGGHIAAHRLARLLPPDVRVHRLTPAPPGFDARFSAIWRRYAYRVCDDLALADPLARHATLWYRGRLDVAAMNQAAQGCLGEHDFAAFCRRRDGASTVRTLLRLDWARTGAAVAEATVVADAFCHNMVRALVGALLKVGDGSQASRLARPGARGPGPGPGRAGGGPARAVPGGGRLPSGRRTGRPRHRRPEPAHRSFRFVIMALAKIMMHSVPSITGSFVRAGSALLIMEGGSPT